MTDDAAIYQRDLVHRRSGADHKVPDITYASVFEKMTDRYARLERHGVAGLQDCFGVPLTESHLTF